MEHRPGETFTPQGIRWQVYEIRPDGTVCSKALGKADQAQKQTPVQEVLFDSRPLCSFQTTHRGGRTTRCQKSAVKETTLCDEHQWAMRYAVNRTTR